MARLREADVQVGDRLRYYEPYGDHHVGTVASIERRHGLPAVALFTCDDGTHLIIRLCKLVKYAQRVSTPAVA